MTRRIQRLAAGLAAFAAVALGGAVFAQAQSSPAGAPERTSAPDRDHVQSGDQTTADTPASAAAVGNASHLAGRASLIAAATSTGDNVQSGDQSAPDPTGATGATGEQTAAENPEQSAGSESAPASDGPGGHADEPGNPNADHQFQGNE